MHSKWTVVYVTDKIFYRVENTDKMFESLFTFQVKNIILIKTLFWILEVFLVLKTVEIVD